MASYTVNVNGKTFKVNNPVVRGDQVSFVIDNKEYQVEVSSENLSSHPVHATGLSSPVAYQAKAIPDSSLPGEVRSPMPGLVTQILVTSGQQVAFGQKIIIIEAMKMENNITAPKAGKISAIHVNQGQEVENRKLLITIE